MYTFATSIRLNPGVTSFAQLRICSGKLKKGPELGTQSVSHCKGILVQALVHKPNLYIGSLRLNISDPHTERTSNPMDLVFIAGR